MTKLGAWKKHQKRSECDKFMRLLVRKRFEKKVKPQAFVEIIYRFFGG